MSPAVRSRRADVSREALRRERAHHRRSLFALRVVAGDVRAYRMIRAAAVRVGEPWAVRAAEDAVARCEHDAAAIYDEARWSA